MSLKISTNNIRFGISMWSGGKEGRLMMLVSVDYVGSVDSSNFFFCSIDRILFLFVTMNFIRLSLFAFNAIDSISLEMSESSFFFRFFVSQLNESGGNVLGHFCFKNFYRQFHLVLIFSGLNPMK